MSTNPPRVSDWLRTAAPFNLKKHGLWAIFTGDNSVVERLEPEKYRSSCVCYTSHPLPPGQVWEITILNTISSGWRGLGIGVTTTLPDYVPLYLVGPNAGPDQWYYFGQSLYHNRKQTKFPDLPSLNKLRTQQHVGIQITENGDLNIFIDGNSMKTVATGLPVHQAIFGVVDVGGKCTRIKSEILSDPSVITDERAQEIIDQGLKTSRLNQRQVVAVITGLMGSGKTTLLSRLFNRPPPDLYTSTGLAEQSCRSLLHHIGCMSTGSWRLLSEEDIREFLAPLFLAGMTEANLASLSANLMHAMDPLDTTASDAIALPSQAPMETSSEAVPLSTPSSTATELCSLPKKSPTSQAMVNLVKSTTGSTSQVMLEVVHMIDTGGQPELMEVMPSFIHNANLGVLVINCMHDLNGCPAISFHEEGVAYNRKLSSQYTGREVVLKLASTLQAKKSCSTTGSHFRLLVVATHRDCVEGDVEARILALNRELKSLLLPAFKKELILYETPDKIAFVLNLKKPEKCDENVLELFRTNIADGNLGEVFEVPGSFFMFEQDLIKFATDVGRNILSFEECMQVGVRLKMSRELVQAALVLFHRQNTFLYFRHVLPNHIFVKPQVPLDCVNGIVRFSYRVGDGKLKGFPAKFVPLLKDGIITEEMLNHKELSFLFIPGLYEPSHVIKLLRHTFNIAPLSHDIQQTKKELLQPMSSVPSNCEDEYLMMCLLPAIPDQELCRKIPSSSDTVPLVVKFNNDCVPMSCFSSTISCLLSTYNWKVCRKADDGTPECLAHNISSLFDPDLPVKIVLVDANRQIEVYLKSDEEDRDILPEICSKVVATVFGAIHKVFDVMRLTEIEISPAVLCPCQDKSVAHTACHYTALKRDYLRCSKTGDSVGKAQAQHMMWLNTKPKTQPSTSSEKPTLPKLLDLNVPADVSDKYEEFGIILLKDEDGKKMDVIKNDCRGEAKKITLQILKKWMEGDGMSVTWESLITALRKCAPLLADQIEITLNKH